MSRTLPLLFAVALSAVPFLVLAGPEVISYDGWWHVFIARQGDWGNLWDEIHRNAHPPLFYLLLKATIATLGPGAWSYRLISIAATLGSAWLVGRIVDRTSGRIGLAAVAAFAFGGALSTVSVGLDVRAYALCTFFVLGALLALLRLAESSFSAPDPRDRVLFALLAGLALATHYVAAFFLLGCWAAVAILTLLGREYRRRVLGQARRHWLANLLTFGAPLAVLAIEYAVHVSERGRLHHVPAFLFDPRREGASSFLWRNTRALIELFVPPLDYPRFASTTFVTAPAMPDAVVVILVFLALAGIGWLGCRPLREAGGREVAGRIPALVLAAMTAAIVVAALLGRYPYGGLLRHQYLLFPFLVIVLAQGVGTFARRAGRRVGGVAVGLLAVAALLNATNWAVHFRIVPRYAMQDEVVRFYESFPSPGVVYVEQFNLIHLFAHHHEERWRFVERLEEDVPVDVWRVGDGTRELSVCRDRGPFHLDLTSRCTYLRMRRCLEATGRERLAVLRTQHHSKIPDWPVEQTEELATRAAGLAGLVAERVVVDGESVYAAFALRGNGVRAIEPGEGPLRRGLGHEVGVVDPQ